MDLIKIFPEQAEAAQTDEGSTPEGTAAAAPESDAQAADDAVAASEPAADGEGEEPTEGGSKSKLQKLVDDKYQGDEDAFVDGLYQQWNSSADMAKELKELRQELSELRKPTAEPEAIADSPDIQWLTNQLEDVKAERAELGSKRTHLLQRMAKAEAEVNQLKGAMRNAEEFERKSLERDAAAAERESERLADQWNDLKREERRLDKDAKAYDIQLERARKAAQSQVQEQQRSRVEAVREQKESLETFVAAVKAEAKELGIPEKNLKHMANTIRGELFFYLQSMLAKDPNAEGIDVAEAVKVRARAYAKAMGLERKAGAPAAAASPAPSTPGAKPNAAPPRKPVATPSPKNKAEADAWVRQVFMGRAQR
jgi:hypothetical protein